MSYVTFIKLEMQLLFLLFLFIVIFPVKLAKTIDRNLNDYSLHFMIYEEEPECCILAVLDKEG